MADSRFINLKYSGTRMRVMIKVRGFNVPKISIKSSLKKCIFNKKKKLQKCPNKSLFLLLPFQFATFTQNRKRAKARTLKCICT